MRLPRPNRASRVSVRSLTRQLGVGEATAHDLIHRKHEAIFIGEVVVLRGAIVEPEYLLRNVPIKMERFDRNISSLESAFQETPEILDAVGMNLSAYIFLKVIHCVMHEVAVRQIIITVMQISVDGRFLFDVSQNLILQGISFYVRNDPCTDTASFTVFYPHHDGLVRNLRAIDSHSLEASANGRAVHVCHSTADECLVHFNRSAIGSAELDQRSVFHRLANPVKHEPCRLLRDAKSAVNLVAGDSVLTVADHPDCRHPLVETHRGILENRPHLDGELLLAAVAEPKATGLNKRIGFRAATGARNFAIRPAKPLGVVKSAVCVCEVSYCLSESYGFFHFSHLQSKNSIAQIILCVKYVITGQGNEKSGSYAA